MTLHLLVAEKAHGRYGSQFERCIPQSKLWKHTLMYTVALYDDKLRVVLEMIDELIGQQRDRMDMWCIEIDQVGPLDGRIAVSCVQSNECFSPVLSSKPSLDKAWALLQGFQGIYNIPKHSLCTFFLLTLFFNIQWLILWPFWEYGGGCVTQWIM